MSRPTLAEKLSATYDPLSAAAPVRFVEPKQSVNWNRDPRLAGKNEVENSAENQTDPYLAVKTLIKCNKPLEAYNKLAQILDSSNDDCMSLMKDLTLRIARLCKTDLHLSTLNEIISWSKEAAVTDSEFWENCINQLDKQRSLMPRFDSVILLWKINVIFAFLAN